jgi:pyruvate kinase
VGPAHRVDAINLVHYLALRHGDVRHLQRWLGARGLSSLGRCEAHVLATVESVRTALDGTEPQPGPTAESFEAGRSALDRNTDALFGARPPGRVPRIMVTLPSEAANDFALVRRLVSKGMDVALKMAPTTAPAHGSAWRSMFAGAPQMSGGPAECRWTAPYRAHSTRPASANG